MYRRPHLWLASNSPRRRQLLDLGEWTFTIAPTIVNENLLENEQVGEYVIRLAETKARSAVIPDGGDQLVLGADTAVVDGREIMGKPKDSLQAQDMLRRLRGHNHQVFTGIALLQVATSRCQTDLCVTEVPMRSYSEAEIITYVSSGDPLDKAGGYGIQNSNFNPVVGLQGCYASVMGLPLCHLVRSLRKFDIPVNPDIADACQEHLNYECPVSDAILSYPPVIE